MEKEEAQDRRSLRTRQALIDALLALIETKHYDTITVQEIVDRANVGRSTFYAHFESKDELLSSGFGYVLERLVQHMKINEDNQLEFDVSMIFLHARQHYEIYRTLIWGSGFEIITRGGHSMLAQQIEDRLASLVNDKTSSNIPLPLIAYSMAGGLLLLLNWWLENKMNPSPERMNEIFQELVMPGICQIFEYAE